MTYQNLLRLTLVIEDYISEIVSIKSTHERWNDDVNMEALTTWRSE